MKEKPNHTAPGQEQVYKTGPTAPPKSYGGIIAVLLVAVILLGGLASVLGIMNIRLMEKLSLESRDDTPIYFSPRATGESACLPDSHGLSDDSPALGILVEDVTAFLQAYYDLPEGVYITAVTDGSSAQTAGCIPGDIILAFEGNRITSTEALKTQLQTCAAGQEVTLTLYRAGNEISVPLILHSGDDERVE